MIEYRTTGDAVSIEINSGVGKFTFKHECGRDYLASLMRDQHQKHMNSVLEEVRRQSYNQGWKDAKSKSKKVTWFKGWW